VAFDTICKEKGYSKTGKIREFIRNLIKEELPGVKASTEEWSGIEEGIREIQQGEYLTLEELKKRIRNKKMDHPKNRKNRRPKYREP
jgi:predicted transcriptional regulator